MSRTYQARPRLRKKLYGIDDKIAGPFSRNCLLARRLVESGVRFVSVISGTGGGAGWDCHNNIQGSTSRVVPEHRPAECTDCSPI